jgi:hypothetical protein
MLSKILIQYLIKKLTLEEIREFNKMVLLPQKAKNLSEHFVAAEEILIQQNQKNDENKSN